WYPGLVLDPRGDEVVGEVYEVPSKTLAALDEFEGAEFERVRAVVQPDDGKPVEAWVYAFRGGVEGRAPRRPADWLLAEE
ncbi:MAG: gamma-glutamylcyclotransferase, partial [Akkermansiaceae bacterium]|nr:gamma-glutamylcyclotransferase [Akkermansiaceae bacterium]